MSTVQIDDIEAGEDGTVRITAIAEHPDYADSIGILILSDYEWDADRKEHYIAGHVLLGAIDANGADIPTDEHILTAASAAEREIESSRKVMDAIDKIEPDDSWCEDVMYARERGWV